MNHLRYYWPWCGWFGKHEWILGRCLTILSEGICLKCGLKVLSNHFEGGTLPWSKRAEEFFERRRESDQRRAAQATD